MPEKSLLEIHPPTEIKELWEKRYQQFVTLQEGKTDPDLLLFALPNDHNIDLDARWPHDISLTYNLFDYSAFPSGLAMLATRAAERGNYSAGICYSDSLFAADSQKNTHPFTPYEAAMTALSSQAGVIGISLISSMNLEFARTMIEQAKSICAEKGIEPPMFIVGGPQASLDHTRTAETLGIPQDCVVRGRGEEGLLRLLDRKFERQSYYQGIKDDVLFDPLFAQLPEFKDYKAEYARVGFRPIGISAISIGGVTCVGENPCAFCTAYHLGKRREIPEQDVYAQIDLLKQAKYTYIDIQDNFINLVRPTERERFLRILEYMRRDDEKGKPLHISSFLTRPDLLALTPPEVLTRIKELKVGSVFLGIESGDTQTLLEMERARGGEAAANQYLQRTLEACRMLKNAGIKTALSSIVAYPVDGADGREADRRTLEHLSLLIREGSEISLMEGAEYAGKIEVLMNPVLPFPGSKLYQELIGRGASPQALDSYAAETQQAKIDFFTAITHRHDENEEYTDFETLLLRKDPETMNKLLDFFDDCRQRLNDLLVRKYRFTKMDE